jgi:uncharacterized integral membrane protein
MNDRAQRKPPAKNTTLPWIGLCVTILWLVLVAVYATRNWTSMVELKPFEVADFAAGVFAPLAFLWLVLGFFQQGEELRNSGQALWLQGQELQNSVEQQRELVNVTREQLKFESEVLTAQRDEIARNSRPLLELNAGGSMPSSNVATRLYRFDIANHGKSCTKLRANVDGKTVFRRDVLSTGDHAEFDLELPEAEFSPFRLNVNYLDERLISGNQTFAVGGTHTSYKISAVD